MAGTHEGGVKAMNRRAEKENKSAHEVAQEMGEKGGHESSGRKAMETRAEREGKSTHEVAQEMGQKGGKAKRHQPA